MIRQNEVILFQGDSITDGNRGRNADLNHVMGHGYQFIVGARLHVDNLDKNIQTFNRGISGNEVNDLRERWVQDTIELNPTLLSILVGVNDGMHYYEKKSDTTPEKYDKIYRTLLDDAKKSNGEMRFVIMEPFIGENFADCECKKFMRGYIAEIQQAARSIAKDYGAIFVPLQETFNEYSKKVGSEKLIWDGIHPTIIGPGLIADKWLECFNAES